MDQSLRIVIADDDRHARAGLRALLTASLACDIVGEAANGEDAVAQVARYGPDAVVLDLRMPMLDGMQATRIIKERWPAITVVALTMYVGHRDAALAAGADAFVSKLDPPHVLISALEAVMT